jgi:cbb3-type cytochrome c oxidase subunit III
MASLHHLAAVLLTFGLLTGCGGDRARGGSRADTTGAAAVTPDSAAMPMKDTGRAAAPDTAGSSAAPADTAKPPSAAAQAAKPSPTTTAAADTSAKRAPSAKPKQMAAADARTAHDAGAAPSAQAKRDTGRVQAAESTRSAATPTPAPTAQQQMPAPAPQPSAPPAQQQDTSKQGGAQQDTTQQEAPLRDAYHQAPRDTVDQATYDGWKQFNLNCARCHGEDALGTTIAPHLIMSLKPDGPINTKELFVQTVCAGRPAKGMPSWCALGLDMGKINDIYLYVKGRSAAKIAPGRPAVKSGG